MAKRKASVATKAQSNRKRPRPEVQVVVATSGFPVSHRKSNSKRPDINTKDREQSMTKNVLDWYDTAHEIKKLGSSGFQGKQRKDYQDEEYQRLTGRAKKQQQVPLKILRGIRKKREAREARAMQEARESGVIVPKMSPASGSRRRKLIDKTARLYGPSPTIGFMKKGMLLFRQ